MTDVVNCKADYHESARTAVAVECLAPVSLVSPLHEAMKCLGLKSMDHDGATNFTEQLPPLDPA